MLSRTTLSATQRSHRGVNYPAAWRVQPALSVSSGEQPARLSLSFRLSACAAVCMVNLQCQTAQTGCDSIIPKFTNDRA